MAVRTNKGGWAKEPLTDTQGPLNFDPTTINKRFSKNYNNCSLILESFESKLKRGSNSFFVYEEGNLSITLSQEIVVSQVGESPHKY